jgi:ABC-type antimicrobial peptide transport system permease subunit
VDRTDVAQGPTLLIMLGPIVGVAAMVGAVGLTESAKGDLKQKLSELGTNLIIANAGGTFGRRIRRFRKMRCSGRRRSRR